MLTSVISIKPCLEDYIEQLKQVSDLDIVVRSTTLVTIALEDVYASQDRDPVPPLTDCIKRQLAYLEDSDALKMHQAPASQTNEKIDTGELFEAAWTTFGPETYDHSVSLVETRLRLSGFDENYFKDKTVFDGGAGIGRLSIAASKMGAKHVVAADIGQKSLDYVNEQTRRLNIDNIETVTRDVVSLSDIEDGSFDFVASNGVLHHTPDCIGGLREHFRITKSGGTFWIYLYGDGGIYWPVYDKIRDVVSRFPVSEIKRALQRLSLREGLVYTYLDNVLAPRTYHYENDIVAMLKQIDPNLTWRRAKGSSVIDDPEKCLSAQFGPLITGPQGEVRIAVTKS